MDPEFENYLLMRQAPPSTLPEGRQWKEALSLQPNSGAPPDVQLVSYWGRAVAAGLLHDAVAAQDALKHYDELLEAGRKGPRPYIADGLRDEQQLVRLGRLRCGQLRPCLLRAVADNQD